MARDLGCFSHEGLVWGDDASCVWRPIVLLLLLWALTVVVLACAGCYWVVLGRYMRRRRRSCCVPRMGTAVPQPCAVRCLSLKSGLLQSNDGVQPWRPICGLLGWPPLLDCWVMVRA